MYAYNFQPRFRGIKHNLVFIAMPFAPSYDWIYTDLIRPAIYRVNKKLNKEQKLKPYLAKEDLRTRSGWNTILEKLTTAQIVFGVLTSNNPNVFYELGIAHATQPETRQVLIAPKGYKPKFDMKDLIYYQYDKKATEKSIEGIASKIKDALDSYKIEEEKLVHRAKMRIGPYGLEVMLIHGARGHFAISTSDEFKTNYEKTYGPGSLDRHLQGLSVLCGQQLLALSTTPRDGTNRIEFSYYWTSLGLDVLYLSRIIQKKETLNNLRTRLPRFMD